MKNAKLQKTFFPRGYFLKYEKKEKELKNSIKQG